MEIQPLIPSTVTPLEAGAARPEISADFETFLKMLTVQMTNQDPLNPIDSSDYAVQLATFSGVEQQVQTNDLLKSLAAQMGASGLVQMASLVGKEARAAVAANWEGAPIAVAPQVASGATSAELVVRTADGTEVQRLAIPTDGTTLDWVGTDQNGQPLPYGRYAFETVSYRGEEVAEVTPAEVYARIVEVQAQGNRAMLTFAGGDSTPAASVTALRDPAGS